jgi:hypothetical protein
MFFWTEHEVQTEGTYSAKMAFFAPGSTVRMPLLVGLAAAAVYLVFRHIRKQMRE